MILQINKRQLWFYGSCKRATKKLASSICLYMQTSVGVNQTNADYSEPDIGGLAKMVSSMNLVAKDKFDNFGSFSEIIWCN